MIKKLTVKVYFHKFYETPNCELIKGILIFFDLSKTAKLNLKLSQVLNYWDMISLQ
jgi:hypothetical protein